MILYKLWLSFSLKKVISPHEPKPLANEGCFTPSIGVVKKSPHLHYEQWWSHHLFKMNNDYFIPSIWTVMSSPLQYEQWWSHPFNMNSNEVITLQYEVITPSIWSEVITPLTWTEMKSSLLQHEQWWSFRPFRMNWIEQYEVISCNAGNEMRSMCKLYKQE